MHRLPSGYMAAFPSSWCSVSRLYCNEICRTPRAVLMRHCLPATETSEQQHRVNRRSSCTHHRRLERPQLKRASVSSSQKRGRGGSKRGEEAVVERVVEGRHAEAQRGGGGGVRGGRREVGPEVDGRERG